MKALVLAATLILATPVLAQQTDPRIQVVDYDPDRIVTVRGTMGYQLMLEFGSDERIENVSIGDSLAWQVTPNRRADVLFLKPIEEGATNMTVLTDQRRYVFDLVAGGRANPAAPYVVRFTYPAPVAAVVIVEAVAPEPDAPPTVAFDGYLIAGSADAAPARVFDDGRMTYFEWPPTAAVPAIFAVAADGSESVVNYGVRGAFVVVEQVSPRFALRNGAAVATVTNPVLAPAPETRR